MSLFKRTKKSVYLWKSLKVGMKSGWDNSSWTLNEWRKEFTAEICESGFHACEHPLQAMGYVACEVIARVEVRGKLDIGSDKQSWSEMRIVEAYEWTKEDSVSLSIFAAELCISNFEKVFPDDKRPREAIEAAKEWLKNPTSASESAAESAAWSARSAAESAARSTAWSAARSAAESAAWSAWSARSAAESAARSTAESAAESAARSTAESAAWSAAESAAESAAWSARSAAESAARSTAAKRAAIEKQCNDFVLSRIEMKKLATKAA